MTRPGPEDTSKDWTPKEAYQTLRPALYFLAGGIAFVGASYAMTGTTLAPATAYTIGFLWGRYGTT